ncbi:MAG: helix-turn-helix transcriptional regulator [Paracoccus sp. (in: a-proteobacteria)]|uniref:helix-turn-helix transcriptional regulator n=1 Tax=Paracoccus sp. TaxID=267 RepID=UPI0026DEA886|nr:helix-turn-helix transcriptional regulator [Paracoccus sp. (in: a-proteobacteria)]MDO5630234.1 helix-turn-helix transcriptional regulator [Paracoccus sp. (in: a-proteobacteria)]
MEYGAALDRLTRIAADFDMSCIFGFSAQQPPVLIHDGYSDTVDRRALRSYLRGAYLLDPFYSASIGEVREGLWRMRDLAPDAYYDAEFAWSQEIHPCISDQAGTLVEEIGYITPLSDGFSATYSLMRNRGGTCFDLRETKRLSGLGPIISASLRLHWEVSRGRDQSSGSPLDSEEVFSAAFFVLTPAQQAVTKLILRGHSNISIAGNLGIAEGTVKQHRYNIYKRLDISGQAELFQRFIDFIGR